MKSRLYLSCPLNFTGIGTHAQFLCRELIQDPDLDLYINIRGSFIPSLSLHTTELFNKHLIKQTLHKEYDRAIVLDTPSNALRDRKLINFRCPTYVYTVYETSIDLDSLRKSYEKVALPAVWQEDVVPDLIIPEGSDLFDQVTCDSDVLNLWIQGKFEKRKGYFPLIEALEKIDREVILRASCQNHWAPLYCFRYLEERGWKIVDGMYKFNKASFIFVPPKKWHGEIEPCHAAIFPHYSEGWGLPILEAICSGIPVYATNNGASSSYLDTYYDLVGDRNRIPSGPWVPAVDNLFFKKDSGFWRETKIYDVLSVISNIDIDDLRRRKEYFRDVSSEMHSRFSWKKSAEIFKDQVLK